MFELALKGESVPSWLKVVGRTPLVLPNYLKVWAEFAEEIKQKFR